MTTFAKKTWVQNERVPYTEMNRIENGIEEALTTAAVATGGGGLAAAYLGSEDYLRFELFTGKSGEALTSAGAMSPNWTGRHGSLLVPGRGRALSLQEEERINGNEASVVNDTVGAWATRVWRYAYPDALASAITIDSIYANFVWGLKSSDTNAVYIDDVRITVYNLSAAGAEVADTGAIAASLAAGAQVGRNSTGWYKYVIPASFDCSDFAIPAGNFLGIKVEVKLRTTSGGGRTAYAFLNPGPEVQIDDRGGSGIHDTMTIERSIIDVKVGTAAAAGSSTSDLAPYDDNFAAATLRNERRAAFDLYLGGTTAGAAGLTGNLGGGYAYDGKLVIPGGIPYNLNTSYEADPVDSGNVALTNSITLAYPKTYKVILGPWAFSGARTLKRITGTFVVGFAAPSGGTTTLGGLKIKAKALTAAGAAGVAANETQSDETYGRNSTSATWERTQLFFDKAYNMAIASGEYLALEIELGLAASIADAQGFLNIGPGAPAQSGQANACCQPRTRIFLEFE